MSLKNRKSVYDKLVALGDQHYHRISDALKKEFGTPESTPEDTNFSGMSKDQLKAEADKLELSYTSKATKDDLVVLLENKSDEPKDDEPEEEEKEEVE